MYGDPTPPVDPYADTYNAPQPAGAAEPAKESNGTSTRGRSRSRSPARSNGGYRSPPRRRSPAPPTKRASHAPVAPNPSSVLGVFGLSIRTQERDLDEEFSRFGRVDKVTIVYDQRSDRSRGFGFIKMSTTEEASRCIQELNGVELNGRRIRVDYSVTDRPHAPTPGQYMGHRRSGRDSYYGGRDSRDSRDSHRDRDRRDRDKDRDPYGRDSRDWRDRRGSPPPRSGRHSPDYRRRRSYSRSPARSPAHRSSNYDGDGFLIPFPETSKRGTTHERRKLTNKVRESKKKARKEAKKSTQWKSKHKKDPGIPSTFPYKDQLLGEVAEQRRLAEEAKEKRKEAKRAAKADTAAEDEDSAEVDKTLESVASLAAKHLTTANAISSRPKKAQASEEESDEEDAPMLVNPELPDLQSVLECTDVILNVLDARDPLPCRSQFIEDWVRGQTGKRIVFVLNKIGTP
ncbi:hypothetical protein ONZ45_g18271 [Pleurotus djamor]|nr:hypothetical protein ONZ45_g18271 [Pleurotus djamor]